MNSQHRAFLPLLALLLLAMVSHAATFGTVVPITGLASDIALDSRRGKLYVSNLGAKRIEVLDTASRALGFPMTVPLPPSAVALSPGSRYLVVGEYDNFGAADSDTSVNPKGGITVFDLDAGQQRDMVLANPVLAVEFGAGNQALIVTTGEFLLLDPLTGLTTTLSPTTTLDGTALPVPFVTFPADIIQAGTGVSGDGQTIIILATVNAQDKSTSAILAYKVGHSEVSVLGIVSTPPLGPRAVSVDQNAARYLAGWALWDPQIGLRAQFPYPTGDFTLGGHAWDIRRSTIYADMPVTSGEPPVMHVVDTDNLTVRERIKLPRTMTSGGIFSPAGDALYTLTESGVLVLPVGSLESAPRVVAAQEDILFRVDPLNPDIVTQFLDISDPSGGNVDFTLSLPDSARGIRLSQISGKTPATVRIEVDPTVYQNNRGTASIPLTIESAEAVNIPPPVRLLINTADINQRGRIVNVPGKLVDMLADPVRNRLYVLRQDKNLVLVYNSGSLEPIDILRTGNTPTSMAITTDQRYLLVGHDNSQYIAVFDLETLKESAPVPVLGAYPRSVATANGAIWATSREVTDPGLPCGAKNPLYRVNFEHRLATAPPRLGIFCNDVPPESALRPIPGGNYILLAQPDGTVALWDGTVPGGGLWVVSRNDLKSAGGAFEALTDNLYVVGSHVLDRSLFPVAEFQTGTGTSSGAGVLDARGLRTTAGTPEAPGTIERIDLGTRQSTNATSLVESPQVVATLMTATIGQIGQTILPFTRTLAVPADQQSIVLLTRSGLTVLPPNYDDPVVLPPQPVVTVTRVVNAADGEAGVAPGGLIVISGEGLASGSVAAPSVPLPFALGGTRVTVNGIQLPLVRVSPTEIVAQLPFTMSGAAPLIVRNAAAVSNTFTVNIQSYAPAIFRTGQAGDPTRLAAVIRARNNDFVNFTNPIHPNEVLVIYLTGLGQVEPQVALGAGAPFDPLALTTATPQVTLGGVTLPVQFAGLVPGQVGVYQLNVFVPDNVESQAQTTLTIQQGEASTSLQVRVVSP